MSGRRPKMLEWAGTEAAAPEGGTCTLNCNSRGNFCLDNPESWFKYLDFLCCRITPASTLSTLILIATGIALMDQPYHAWHHGFLTISTSNTT